MKNGWGMVTGLAAAGLLVAAPPAWAGNKDKSAERSTTKSQDSSTSADRTGTSGSATGSIGSSTGSSATDSTQASASSSSSNQVTGKVEKFNRSSKELTLALKVSDSTQVTKDGQQASLSDIKEGDQVRASFSGSGDTLQVTQIEVMSKGSMGSSKSGSSSSSGASGSSSTGSTGSSSGTGSSSSDQSGSTSGSSGSGSSTSGSSTGSGKGY